MYLKLVVWPWPLVIHYDMPYHQSLATAWPWVLPVASLMVGAVYLLWRNRASGFLGAVMLLILSPTLVVPIPPEIAAERRMYLPLAAIVALAIVGGYATVEQLLQASATADKASTSGTSATKVIVVSGL